MHVNLLKEKSTKICVVSQASSLASALQVVKATSFPHNRRRVNDSIAANEHKFLRGLHHVDVQQNCPTMHRYLTGNNLLTVIERILPESCPQKHGGGQLEGSAVQLSLLHHVGPIHIQLLAELLTSTTLGFGASFSAKNALYAGSLLSPIHTLRSTGGS